VLPDGTLVEGVEVFRRAYAAVGLGWLVAPTRWPLLRPLADAAYRWFARNRLRLTGRGEVCNADRCAVHAPGAGDPSLPREAAARPR
jgi:predicted DCC family thiol-disulfide oxidoreductase YuxK